MMLGCLFSPTNLLCYSPSQWSIIEFLIIKLKETVVLWHHFLHSIMRTDGSVAERIRPLSFSIFWGKLLVILQSKRASTSYSIGYICTERYLFLFGLSKQASYFRLFILRTSLSLVQTFLLHDLLLWPTVYRYFDIHFLRPIMRTDQSVDRRRRPFFLFDRIEQCTRRSTIQTRKYYLLYWVKKIRDTFSGRCAELYLIFCLFVLARTLSFAKRLFLYCINVLLNNTKTMGVPVLLCSSFDSGNQSAFLFSFVEPVTDSHWVRLRINDKKEICILTIISYFPDCEQIIQSQDQGRGSSYFRFRWSNIQGPTIQTSVAL